MNEPFVTLPDKFVVLISVFDETEIRIVPVGLAKPSFRYSKTDSVVLRSLLIDLTFQFGFSFHED